MRADWLPPYFRAEFPRECAIHEPSSPPNAVRRSLNEFAPLLTVPGRDQPRRMLLPTLRCAGTLSCNRERELTLQFRRFARHFTSTDGLAFGVERTWAEWAGRFGMARSSISRVAPLCCRQRQRWRVRLRNLSALRRSASRAVDGFGGAVGGVVIEEREWAGLPRRPRASPSSLRSG
jgi:hypothetical protein